MDWFDIATARGTLRDSEARLVWCPERQNIYLVAWHNRDHCWCVVGGYPLLEQPTHWARCPTPPIVTQDNIPADQEDMP